MNEIVETAVAVAKAIMENPVVAGLAVGAVRNVTGYLQKVYKEKTGKAYDKKVFAATVTKYLVAVSALGTLVSALGVPASVEVASAITLITDIGWSAVKKLRAS